MGESAARAKVSVALVGVGPIWDLHYRDAVQRLSSRLCVKAVCDSVALRATAVAEEFQATAVSCPWLLTQRKDLDAWLILDPGWFGPYPARLAVEHRRAALLANPFSAPVSVLVPLLHQARDRDEMLVLEFAQRFTPATTRLRELIATRLGRIRTIEITVDRPGTSESIRGWLLECASEVVELFDWSSCLAGGGIPRVELTSGSLQLSFPERNGFGVRVSIRFAAEGPAVRAVECESGRATLTGPAQISWQVTGGGCQEEVLCHERSPHEIVLDQFCRRALGGLVPVPSIHDAFRSLDAVQAAARLFEDRDHFKLF